MLAEHDKEDLRSRVYLYVFQMEVELNVSPGPDVTRSDAPSVCIRAGCNNPPIHSKDWDREYCSNECVATHCRYTHIHTDKNVLNIIVVIMNLIL